MSGHLEEAAGAFNAAGQQVPVEHVQAAMVQIPGVVQAIQQAGGSMGQELAQAALGLQNDLESIAGRMQELRQRLDAAAQHVMRGAA